MSPDDHKAKKARNAKKAAGKALREEGLGKRVPGGSAESEAGPYIQVVPRQIIRGDMCKYVYGQIPVQQ